MTITINEQDKKLVVTLVGDLDNMASSEAERSFAPIYDRSDCDVVFDRAVLLNLNEEVMEVFAIGGFLQLFKTAED